MASNEATIPTGTDAPEGTRRYFLYIATGTVAAVGAAAVLVPLIAQMNPDASTLAAGGPVDLDVSNIAPGQQVVVRWRERPIFVFHRTPETLKTLQDPKLLALLSDPNSQQMQQPPYAANATRSIKPEFGVLVGILPSASTGPWIPPAPQSDRSWRS
jgi:ubiquinol-cytochrome c reductase iron-sulfur subunit